MAEPSFMAIRRDLLRRRGEEEYLRKRREIVVAAADVFKRKGFRSTSVADIAAATGLDRATLYLYIEGKEDAFQEVVLEATLANVEMVEALVESEAPVPDRLARLIEDLLASYGRHYPFLLVYVQEDMNQLDDGSEWGQAMRALGRRFDTAVVSMVREGIANGTLAVGDDASAKVIAYGLIGMCNWAHRWFDPEGLLSADEVGKKYAEMILEGLRPRG